MPEDHPKRIANRSRRPFAACSASFDLAGASNLFGRGRAKGFEREGALETSYSLAGAALVGALLHMLLSAVFGAVFGALVALVPTPQASRSVLVGAASLYGLALWVVNFYVIAPVAFEWFQDADPVVQFFAHTFFFGALLGAMLSPRVLHGAPVHRRREPLGA